MSVGFRVVDENVARNPIARAIAKKRIADAVRDFSARLHMLEDGDNVSSDIQASAKVLAVAARILGKHPEYSIEAGIITGGLSALANISQCGCAWRKRHLQAVTAALDLALETYLSASAQETQEAYRYVEGLQ